jgi:hypothetical protein
MQADLFPALLSAFNTSGALFVIAFGIRSRARAIDNSVTTASILERIMMYLPKENI